MKRILFLGLFFLLIFLFKPSSIEAQYSPSTYYCTLGGATAQSYKNLTTGVCTNGTYTSFYHSPTCSSNASDVGKSVLIQPCNYVYYQQANCAGNNAGYHQCTSTVVSSTSPGGYTCTQTSGQYCDTQPRNTGDTLGSGTCEAASSGVRCWQTTYTCTQTSGQYCDTQPRNTDDMFGTGTCGTGTRCYSPPRWKCENRACVRSTTGGAGTYPDARCDNACQYNDTNPTISCPICNEGDLIAPYSKTQCAPSNPQRGVYETTVTVSCDDLGSPETSCNGSGTQGGCKGDPNNVKIPTCYIKGTCDRFGEYFLTCDNGSCETAIGEVSTDPAGFINSLFVALLGISSGIAVLLIIISGYRLMASRGNKDQVQHAREQLTAAIVGLLFVIFSLVILQVIGYDILRLPGFNP